jgi:hypothetical protein
MWENANLQIGRTKAVEQLRSGVLGQLGACLGFYYDLLIHDHIDALYAKLLSFVRDSSPYFARHSMSTRQKLSLQRHHVEVFEKSEVVVNLEKRPDHGSGECFFQQTGARHVPELRVNPNPQSSNPATRTPIATRIYPPYPFNPPNPKILDASGALLLYF